MRNQPWAEGGADLGGLISLLDEREIFANLQRGLGVLEKLDWEGVVVVHLCLVSFAISMVRVTSLTSGT